MKLGFGTPSVDLQSVLTDLQESTRQADARRKQEHDRWEREYEAARINMWDTFLRFCRPATVEDYLPFIEGHVARYGTDKLSLTSAKLTDKPIIMTGGFGQGVEPLAVDEMEMCMADRAQLFILVSHPKGMCPPAHGASSIDVIIPRHFEAYVPNEGSRGHNSFFFMKNFQADSHRVPLYADVQERIAQ